MSEKVRTASAARKRGLARSKLSLQRIKNMSVISATQFPTVRNGDVSGAGFREDFVSGGAPIQPANVTSAGVLLNFDTPWFAQSRNGTTQTAILDNGFFPNLFAPPNVGVLKLQTDGTSTGGLSLSKQPAVLSYANFSAWQVDIILSTLFFGSAAFRVGFADVPLNDAPTNGIWVRYDTAQNDAYFTWETRSKNSSTGVTDNVTSIQNSVLFNGNGSFYHFRMRSLVAGSVLFSVNNGAEAPLRVGVPNLPNTNVSLSPFIQLLDRGSSTPSMAVDFFSLDINTGRT
jgi:hypothetical protein